MKTSFAVSVSIKNARAPGIMNGAVDDFSFEISGESEYSLEELREVRGMVGDIIESISSAIAGLSSDEPKAEEPKAEEPKAEEPKAEEPKSEEPETNTVVSPLSPVYVSSAEYNALKSGEEDIPLSDPRFTEYRADWMAMDGDEGFGQMLVRVGAIQERPLHPVPNPGPEDGTFAWPETYAEYLLRTGKV
jgi:hypothetical protein